MNDEKRGHLPTKDEIWDAWVEHGHTLDFTERPEWSVAIHRPIGSPEDWSAAAMNEATVPVVTFRKSFERVWRNGETFIKEDTVGNGELVSRKYWKEFPLRRMPSLLRTVSRSKRPDRSP